ncbi:PhzF family phenazine biosynthesis protein [Qipengyuania sp. GH1]|uniref:PhzF family phenazine biosynthesis protein n=1 Tax=Qipengyuania aestuarii TaxID=2867241 RepID=UPI001C88C021|nr:PhzF family phenazine biosynthesis protein [Qipengyuania aestuarii]MBX7536517.1 PhzF family phenazine biosynthesis protein [Qipengyuania aestuarii]
MKLPYTHVDAFASRPFTGNQAAVMPLDEWLDDATLLAIAEENNFAETAFLVKDDTGEADWELRWFTPTEEVRLCGHATLASGHVLLGRDGGEAVSFRTRQSGILEVRKLGEGYELALPAIRTEQGEWPEAAALLGGSPTECWRNPHGYDLFLYPDEDSIHALEPDLRGLAKLGNNLFVCTAPGRDTDVVSRVFVPGGGVDEDPVTGAAHATLTPFWAERLSRESFTAYQASRRGGHVGCRLEGDRAILSGECVTVVEGSFYLPSAG